MSGATSQGSHLLESTPRKPARSEPWSPAGTWRVNARSTQQTGPEKILGTCREVRCLDPAASTTEGGFQKTDVARCRSRLGEVRSGTFRGGFLLPHGQSEEADCRRKALPHQTTMRATREDPDFGRPRLGPRAATARSNILTWGKLGDGLEPMQDRCWLLPEPRNVVGKAQPAR